MNNEFLKYRQKKEAEKIMELLCLISTGENLPEVYAPTDFQINDDYIAPPTADDEYAETKIKINDRYFISPALLKMPGARSAKNSDKNLLDMRGWCVVEAVSLDGDYKGGEPSIDWRDVGTFSSARDVARVILYNDAITAIDAALCQLSLNETEVAPDDFELQPGEPAA